MKKSKFSESQILTILNDSEASAPLDELSGQHGF